MKNIEELVGMRFGALIITAVTNTRNKRYEKIVEATCDCGGLWSGPLPRLRSGNTKSCGCLQPKVASKSLAMLKMTHGESTSGAYASHRAMMRRCYEAGVVNYPNYGGKGVTVCDRWKGVENFPLFLADMGERPKGMTLDRYPNNTGNYEPGNCRWATPAQQARNFSQNHWIEVDGVRLILKDWADKLGVTPTTILDRIRKGMSEQEAVTTLRSPRSDAKVLDFHGEALTLKQASERFSLPLKALRRRVSEGFSLEDAVSIPLKSTGVRGGTLEVDGETRTYLEWSKVSCIPYRTILDRVHRGWAPQAVVGTPLQVKRRKSDALSNNLIQL